MTRDQTLRERLAALAGFRTAFGRNGFQFVAQMATHRDGDSIILGWTSLGAEAGRLTR